MPLPGAMPWVRSPTGIFFSAASCSALPICGGRRGLAEILAQRPEVTAVFCSSDTLALGALVEAQHQGLRVPEDLAVVGLGDQEFAKDTAPPLTTVRLDGTRIGQLAADMIVARSLDQAVDAQRVDIGFSITQRSSG